MVVAWGEEGEGVCSRSRGGISVAGAGFGTLRRGGGCEDN